MTDKQALKRAAEIVRMAANRGGQSHLTEMLALAAHLEALAAQPAEPKQAVAWMYTHKTRKHIDTKRVTEVRWDTFPDWTETPLYAAPPAAEPKWRPIPKRGEPVELTSGPLQPLAAEPKDEQVERKPRSAVQQIATLTAELQETKEALATSDELFEVVRAERDRAVEALRELYQFQLPTGALNIIHKAIGVQACRPEDRAMLQTPEGREMLAKAAASLQPARE